MVSGAGLMTIVWFELAFCTGLPESVTLTTIGEDPAVVGVPLSEQPARVIPAGSVPVMEHVYGVVPPVAVIVALYKLPTVPLGSVPVMARVAGVMTMVSF
jgi:hypothetical protein